MAVKKFEPADISGLDAAGLDEALKKAQAALADYDISGDEVDAEVLDQNEAVLNHIDEITGRKAELAQEQEALDARLQAARERAAAATAPAEEPVDEDPVEEAPVEEAPIEAVEPEPVLASGTRRATVARAKPQAPAVHIKKDEDEHERVTTITAAANVPEFNSGQVLESMADVMTAFHGRSQGRSNPKDMKSGVFQMSPNATRAGVARIKREDGDHVVDRQMSLEEQFAVIMDAGKDPGIESLVAAGGWCSPSETIYELFGYETAEGLIDVPEVTARRGGISFTKGPDFMAIFGDVDAGWIMTEAQAEAGTFTKPCYALECPPFEEVRLDAVGFCATAPLLTDAAYPELGRRVLSLLGLGHQRRKSASTIARIRASIATTINWTELTGNVASGYADYLGALELQAIRIRQSLAMSTTATIEGFAPHWARAAFRNELARRLSLTNPFEVSDADVDRHLAVRNIRLQYVYDYQMLGTGAQNTDGGTNTWTGWPAQIETTLYPAGAYTRLVNDVISLDAVYDHDLLTQNEYTAAFVEEGMAVANTRGFGIKVSVGLNYNGYTGAPAIGGGAGITFATAV